MTRPLARRLARRIAALTTAALVLTAPPAVAARTAHHDARGDVLRLNASVTPQPRWKPGDITQIRVAHRVHRVKVRLDFRDVSRGTSNFYAFKVHTPNGRFDIYGSTSPDQPQGQWQLVTRSGTVPCPRLRHRVHYIKERVKVSAPRRCIIRPARIRVGATASTRMSGPKEKPRFDDAYSSGQIQRSKLGPWLRRG
jgi:hypothetical protein